MGESFRPKMFIKILLYIPFMPKHEMYASAIISGGMQSGIEPSETKNRFPGILVFEIKYAAGSPASKATSMDKNACKNV